ncbi:hypothetical protein BC937DRAFT_94472 [Endogone sp. FLAS-F59071]|nr:hypothetical protein BC937DRAFT_94472 [Endogone sp. FLAS-F59071]|eukprot:RUS20749.1 hypothetical protein BC937DRAFT_94472 [Endogone sp. FLAS-F59071]
MSGQPQTINVPDTMKRELYDNHYNPETDSCIICEEFFLWGITAVNFWEHIKAKHEDLIPKDIGSGGIPSAISIESSPARIGNLAPHRSDPQSSLAAQSNTAIPRNSAPTPRDVIMETEEQHIDILDEQEVSGKDFLKLTCERLKEYGMSGGPAIRILEIVEELKKEKGIIDNNEI